MANNVAIRGKWTIGRVIEVHPGTDGQVRNIKVKTTAGEYNNQSPTFLLYILLGDTTSDN